ncbi:hypothetical protein NECAME_15308 [Necator americanus]|uniref:Uncharacterized protein n=1 Tax=Necator americanus TaxID=51031 RepID=W2SIQ9_NECAM|nr:hypothetical protein NECAME_15308 [Necator americanus]ETN69453.1 hypothetical protein NECAME_15308 [Necator americanus]
MTSKDPSHSYLDELLFAKFAELDQKVALLREEMDSIAMLLERRKRARDTSLSFANQIIRRTDRLPQWAPLETWQAVAVQSTQESCPPILACGVEAESQLYSAELPVEHDQPLGPYRRDAANITSRFTFHPYSRATNNERAALSLPATVKVNTSQAFAMDSPGGIMESPSYLELLAEFEDRLANANAQPIILDHDDCAEDPPSDPDDNIGAVDDD